VTPTRRQVLTPVVLFVAALVWWGASTASPWPALVALGGGIVIGEQLDLQAPRRDSLPMVHAFVLVLIKVATTAQFAIVAIAAETVGVLIRTCPDWRQRPLLLLERFASAAAGYAVYHSIVTNVHGNAKTIVISALAAAIVAQLSVEELVRFGRENSWTFAWRTRGAELALFSSAMLMAVAYNGVDGRHGFGLWAPGLFFVPLFATWYSFRQLDGINRALEQTMESLGVVAEIGGWVPEGHTERVVELSSAVGRALGLDRNQLTQLETAARIQYLGHACLEDEGYVGAKHNPADVAALSADALRGSEWLAPAADVLTTVAATHGAVNVPPVDPQARLAGQVLRVVRDFDRVAQGEKSRLYLGLSAVTSDATGLYDPRAVDALTRVVVRRDFFGRRPASAA
jgi:hypothetical protein